MPDVSPQQDGNASDLATPEGAAADSLSVAMWTFVSRFTGLLRGIMIAAVLGATYFANTYQFTNSLPNFLIFYPGCSPGHCSLRCSSRPSYTTLTRGTGRPSPVPPADYSA